MHINQTWKKISYNFDLVISYYIRLLTGPSSPSNSRLIPSLRNVLPSKLNWYKFVYISLRLIFKQAGKRWKGEPDRNLKNNIISNHSVIISRRSNLVYEEFAF